MTYAYNHAKDKIATFTISNVLVRDHYESLRATSHLFARSFADDGAMVESAPETILLEQEERVLLSPVLAESPRKDLVLVVLLVFFHVVRQISRKWIQIQNFM